MQTLEASLLPKQYGTVWLKLQYVELLRVEAKREGKREAIKGLHVESLLGMSPGSVEGRNGYS